MPKINTSSCEKYMHTLACSHGNYVCQRESWLDCAPCPPPQSCRGNFTSFIMEHLNQSDTEIIVNRCSRGWPYIDTTTTTTKAVSTGLSSTESTGLSSTESTGLSLKGDTKTTASVASSCKLIFITIIISYAVIRCAQIRRGSGVLFGHWFPPYDRCLSGYCACMVNVVLKL